MMQMQSLQAQMKAMQAQIDKQAAEEKKTTAAAPATGEFLQRTSDSSLSFKMPSGGGVTLYGNLDVSLDDVTNGINSAPNNTGGAINVPYGKNGYLPAISSNNTNVGLRGFQPIAGMSTTQFVWQVQANFGVSINSGTRMTNSNQSNSVGGTLASGTSYIGLASKEWGSMKVGKTYAPYQSATDVFNPFAGQLGNMNVVMGNSGGDNRVEFGTPLEHSIWYGSPDYNGFSYAALYSPGQNRAVDSSAIPSGSSDCAGGNIPGSGGSVSPGGVFACNDGSFSNVVSANVVYDNKKDWYLTAAYEMHQNVNRSSDLAPGTLGFTNDQLNAMDTANESAAKIGALYKFDSTGTSIGAIFESLKRDVPAILNYQNERQRNGTWLVITQKLPDANQLSFGWAHAGTAVGDPSQHNDGGPTGIAGNPGQAPNNSANMFTLALKHQVDRNMSFYADIAETVNSAAAHYDLGAGGHGTTTDCHDAGGPIPANGGITGSPNCWAGTHITGVSVGMNYKF